MKADAPTEAAVLAAFEAFLHASEQQDMDRLLALFAPDPDLVLIGTDADELAVGVAEVKKVFERQAAHGLTTSWEVVWSSVSAAGSVAWIAMRGVAHIRAAGQASHVPFRCTAVLEEREGTWLVAQAHTSLPVSE
jgi:uncharacterized protein (TIGR02246 family)